MLKNLEEMDNKILFVDDLQYFLKVENSFLTRDSCSVLKAVNGEEALYVIRKEGPDVIIMDLEMPVMGGDECCRIIKSNPELKNIPVIMVANSWDKNGKKRCIDAGCNDFFFKPVNKKELYSCINDYIHVVERDCERTPCQGEVVFGANSMKSSGTICNVSEEGILIESNHTIALNAEISAVFKLSKLGDAINTSGKIVRIENAPLPSGKTRLGIKFTSISDEGKNSIKSFKKFMHLS